MAFIHKSLFFTFSLMGVSLYSFISSDSMIQIEQHGGRFGDQILHLAHGVWLSQQLKIPLSITEFPFSEKLEASQVLNKTPLNIDKYNQEITLNKSGMNKFLQIMMDPVTETKVLITLPYFSDHLCETLEDKYKDVWFSLDWDNVNFINRLKTLISPLKTIEKPQLPKDRFSVALHIRTGVGFDVNSGSRELQIGYPLKSPPFSYFLKALETIRSITNKPLYVFIFTDDPDPVSLKELLQIHYKKQDVMFHCRVSENSPDINVLEDFFSMQFFDGLIATGSNYSYMVSRLFPFHISITPVSYLRISKEHFSINSIQVRICAEKMGTLSTFYKTNLLSD